MKLLIIVLSLVTICSCKNSTHKSEDERINDEKFNILKLTEKYEKDYYYNIDSIIKIHKEKVIRKIANKYNITYKFDTISVYYSVDYEKYINSGFQILEIYFIHDIYKIKEKYFLALKVDDVYLDMIIPRRELSKIIDLNNINKIVFPISEKEWDGIILIVKIFEIKKIRFEDIKEIYMSVMTEDERYSEHQSDDSNKFFGKGEVIKVFIMEEFI